MKSRLGWILPLLALTACPGPGPAADAQTDAPQEAAPADAQPEASTGSDASMEMDASVEDASSSADGSAVGCCIARPGTAQSFCDPLAALGRDRCNMINGGASCMWSSDALCNDGGAAADASSQDSAMVDANSCCLARPGVAQSVCDAVASFGRDRCNMLNGGASCMWSSSAACGGAPVDAGVVGCCRARPGTAQSFCDPLAALGPDRCNMINGGMSCQWLMGAECSADASVSTDSGTAVDAGCCVAQPGTPQTACDSAPSRERCAAIGAGLSCRWRCG